MVFIYNFDIKVYSKYIIRILWIKEGGKMKRHFQKTIIGLASLMLTANSIPAMDLAYAAGLPQVQAEEQAAATVSEVTITRTGVRFEGLDEDHYLVPGYYMELIANVKLSDGSLAAEGMADVEWKIVSKSGKKVRSYCKIRKPLTKAEAEIELDRRGATNKGTRKALMETLTRSTVLLYVPCGYKNVEDLEITAASKASSQVQSEPYALHVVKKYDYLAGNKRYFQFGLGKKAKGKVGTAKETWDAEKGCYQVKLPTVSTKDKWLKFEGWKKADTSEEENKADKNKIYKAGTVLEDIPMMYGGQMNLEASWKDLRIRDVRDVQYRLDDAGKTVTVQKSLNQKRKYATIPKAVTYNKKKYPVTTIKKKAFAGSSLKGIVLGKNIISIGAEAFAGCGQINMIEIQSAKLGKIGKNAFRGLGKGVTVICPKKCVKRYRAMMQEAGLPKGTVVKGV